MNKFPDVPGIRSGGYSYPGTLRVGGSSQGGPPAIRMQVGFFDPRDTRQRPAGLYTVQFHIDVRAIADPLFKFLNPTARVMFAVEGNTVQRRLSVVNGASISGVCDTVAVEVVDETDFLAPPAPPALPLDYQVTITVAPYPRPSSGSPPVLRGSAGLIAVAGGAVTLLPIPQDSGVNSVLVFASPSGGGVPLVSQEDLNTVTIASWTPTNTFVPLFPQAGTISLGNLGPPLSNVNYNVLFGIDG